MYIVQEFRNLGTTKLWEDRRTFDTVTEAIAFADSMTEQWNIHPNDIRIVLVVVKEDFNDEHSHS